jgi:WD40-like Beta Propeller Repeat
VTLAHSARPPRWPVAALGSGLVLQTTRGLELWDPITGRIIGALPGLFPVATRGSLLVSCNRRCPVLYVTDTRDGARTQITPGRGFHFEETYGGAFSPDGSQVALPAIASDGARRIALVDVRTGAARLVAGARLGVNQQITWSPDGWLYFYAGAGRLAAYRPGRAKAFLLPERVVAFTKMVAS